MPDLVPSQGGTAVRIGTERAARAANTPPGRAEGDEDAEVEAGPEHGGSSALPSGAVAEKENPAASSGRVTRYRGGRRDEVS